MNFKRFFMFFLLLVASVSLVGCAGEKGEKGEKGEQGLQGVQGPTGDKGEAGNDGNQGAQGAQGPQGEKGDKGETGDPGDEVTFRMHEGWLQQKYVTEADTEWENVFYFGNLATWATRYTIKLDLDGGSLEGEAALTDLAYQSKVTLPVPTKEGLIFAGWTDGKEVFEGEITVVKNLTLKATWKPAVYKVTFAGEGNIPVAGQGATTIDEFGVEMVDLFNSPTEADKANTTLTNFTGSTHPNVKYVFDDADTLAKYKWFLEYMKAEIEAIGSADLVTDVAAAYDNTIEMLDKMIAGDTDAIKGDYANGRTALRQFIHRLINKGDATYPGNAFYNPFTVDFSDAAKQAEFVALLEKVNGAGFEYKPGDKLPIPTYEGHYFEGWFDEEGNKVESVEKDGTLTAKWTKLEDKVFDVKLELGEGASFADGYQLPAEIKGSFELPTPVKEGYTFLGWYDANGNKVEKITDNGTLTAKWEVTKFTVSLDANGGVLRAATLDDFAAEMVALFNSPTEADKVTTILTNFVGTTHPNVKYVFDDADTLAKYKWLLEYAKAEIEAIGKDGLGTDVAAAYDNTIEMLDKMIAGDKDAIKGSYANGRTALRQFIHKIINKDNPDYAGNTFYNPFLPDFSKPEQQAEVLAFLDKTTKATEVLEINTALPTPTYEGFKFLGWFDAEGTKFEKATADCELVAKWEVPALAEVVADKENKQIVGGTYISNNPDKYPNPSFYADGGLKVNYPTMGLLTDKFAAQNLLSVNVVVNALNLNTRTDDPNVPAFTVYGYNAAGELVASASLEDVVVGDNFFVLQGEAIVQVKFIMTDYPFNGEKCANVSVAKLIVDVAK